MDQIAEHNRRAWNRQAREGLPYSDEGSLSVERLKRLMERGDPLEFSHSLETQIGGQLRAGFALIGLVEDSWAEAPLSRWFKPLVATRAKKIG